jgi:GntR family transcriptional regulator
VGATLEHHDSRTAALAAEREAILTEKPVWNVQHCPAESGVLPDRLNYAEIADDLIARIRAGELTPGAWLPTYAEMAAQHGVSISTITRAMALLRDRGLVVGTTGRGVRVAGLS